MPGINLAEIKTKNVNKKQVVIPPAQIPKNIELEYKANIRAYNQKFKQAVRSVLFPLIERYAKTFTGDAAITTDGIGDDINRAIEELRNRFDYIALAERISKKMVERVNTVNGRKTINAINNAIGVDVDNIIKSENLTDFIELQTIQNAQLIKSVPLESIEDIRRIVLNGITSGLRAEEIQRQIAGNIPKSVFNKMNNRIATIARTETAKINSQISNQRLQNLGITKAVWDATNDSRTRPCHNARDGKEYNISEGLYSSCDGLTIQPGQEINCRCVARPIVE